jgi:fused signal recognition particle receptor
MNDTPNDSGKTGKGWFARLSAGLSRSSARLTGGIGRIFRSGRLDDAALEELEELLLGADMGPAAAADMAAALGRWRFDGPVTADSVREALAEEIARRIAPVAVPLVIDSDITPFVILVVGVNGTGKTTTIGKLAQRFHGEGRSVMLAAGDTFRAAAVQQLKLWGEKVGVPVVASQAGADPAALAYDALEKARREKVDVLLIDTAGRLHNRKELMEELQKIIRVLRKIDPAVPHACLLVLDATTGQNAHAQVEIFRSMIDVSGLVLTKLDGSAKGGVLIALASRFGLPVHAVGVGEGADDLRAFEPHAFARSLLGLSD